MNDKEKIQKLSRNGKNNWEKKFTWEHISFQYEKVLLGNN
jgi:hypothetical protein